MTFILIFSAMMITIVVLTSCTKLDTKDKQYQDWNIVFKHNDQECYVELNRMAQGHQKDDSITIEQRLPRP